MDRFERLSKIAQDEFGVTIKSKPSTGETFDSLYGETKDSDRREKQIEAIAKVICGGCPDNKECMHCLCADWYRAEALYNAGYRKQSEVEELKKAYLQYEETSGLKQAKQEVAREIFELIIGALEYTRFASPLEKSGTLDYIYSLKNKYTEKSGNDR